MDVPASLALLGCFLLFVGLWLRHELRVADPLIDVRQVRNRQVLTADVSGFMIAVAMYLFLPVIVEFVQVPGSSGYGFGASVVVSGLVLVPLSVGSYLASACLTFYDRHFGTRTMIPFGSILFALSSLFFALEHRSLWEAFVCSALAGVGMGFTFAAMPGFIVRAVPQSETGSAMGFYQVMRSVGLSIGSALAAAVLVRYTLTGQTYPSVGGFRVTLLIASALCASTTVVSYLLAGRATDEMPRLTDEVEELMEEEAETGAVGIMLAGEPPGTSSFVQGSSPQPRMAAELE